MATEADREVIREFLATLGYHVDEPSAIRFKQSLASTKALALATAAAIVATAAATERMVKAFAEGMYKLYYASFRTKASVDNLQAMQFAFEQIGLSSEDALSAVETFARGLRLNPGLMALLENLGVDTSGGDRVMMMFDLVEKLRQMPHFVGAQFAEMFGIPEDVFLHMKEFLPKLRAAHAERLQMQRESGLNAERDARVSKEYMQLLHKIWERVEILGNTIKSKLLPYFRDFYKWVERSLVVLQKWIRSFNIDEAQLSEFIDLAKRLTEVFTLLIGRLGTLWDEHGDKVIYFLNIIKAGAMNTARALASVLEALILLSEGRVGDAVSKIKQAAGELFEDPNLKRPGAEKPRGGGILLEPRGERMARLSNLEARAKEQMRVLGSVNPSLQGEIDRERATLGRGTAGGSTTINVNANTQVRVDGAGNPESTARAVGREQTRVTSDVVRNLVGAVQ